MDKPESERKKDRSIDWWFNKIEDKLRQVEMDFSVITFAFDQIAKKRNDSNQLVKYGVVGTQISTIEFLLKDIFAHFNKHPKETGFSCDVCCDGSMLFMIKSTETKAPKTAICSRCNSVESLENLLQQQDD